MPLPSTDKTSSRQSTLFDLFELLELRLFLAGAYVEGGRGRENNGEFLFSVSPLLRQHFDSHNSHIYKNI